MKIRRFAAVLTAALLAISAVAFFGCGSNKYTITFDYGEGAGTTKSISVEADKEVTGLPVPTDVPTGKTFDCWLTDDGNIFVEGAKLDKDTTLTASYRAIIYTIKYNVDGGEPLNKNAIKTYSVSDKATDLPVPVKSGFEFLGWKESATATPIKAIPAGKTGDLILTAAWGVKEFTITFDYNGGAGIENERKVAYGEKINDLPVPTTVPTDKTFESWLTDDGDLFENGTAYNFEKDITLKAKYNDVVAETYSIEYDVNGGNVLPADAIKTYSVSETDIPLPTPTKAGNEFLGWKESETAEPIKVIPAGKTGNLSLTAEWKVNEYILTFDYDGGEGVETERKVAYGDVITLPVPTKAPEGKILENVSWHIKTADGETFTEGAAYNFEESITLVAVYVSQRFTVTIQNKTEADFTAWADDGTTDERTVYVDIGGKINIPAIQFDTMNKDERNNHDYKFLGWYYKDKAGKVKELDLSKQFTLEGLNVETYDFVVYAQVREQWLGPY